jgi:nitrite reductase/ring-hydroxylating ferredoxin subunit
MSHIEERSVASSIDERCGDCPIATNRRGFLRDTGLAVVAALVASGVRPGIALARIVSEIRPVRAKGDLRSYVIGVTDAVMIDADNDVILARSRGKVYAFSQRCPHKGARLVWHEDESRIYCPKHKARFFPDGEHASGRRSRNLDRYPLRREGREIVVDTGTVYREDADRGAWDAAVIAAQ